MKLKHKDLEGCLPKTCLSDIVVGGLRFYRDSISSILFFRQLPSELAERNSTKTGQCSEVSVI